MIRLPKDITIEEQNYLEAALELVGTNPKLESIWSLMDLAWEENQCDYSKLNGDNINNFYSHPVWLLNGLFIEQHPDSLKHREIFTDEIVMNNPLSVCDYGGGYGGLARMIAKSSARIAVDLYDPYPHRSSLKLSSLFDNLRHVNQLKGPYDVMVATDVFEHVIDPLLEVEKTARHLKVGGKYLIANCFYPVIKCHLPCTYHFRNTFSTILAEMNLQPLRTVVYGTLFEKKGDVLVTPRIRKLEKKSRIKFAFNELMETFRKLRRTWLSNEFQ